VSKNLLDAGTDVAGHLLRTERPADWDALAALYARGGEPSGTGAPAALDLPQAGSA
jgi:hypothetical protein